MTIAVSGLRYNSVVIQTLDGETSVDITNSILYADYYEDILSPCITMTIQVMNSASLFNILPLRGGERVAFSAETGFGEFTLDDEYTMYVYKVSGLDAQKTNEMFTLHLVSREVLTNETNRCLKRYEGNLKETVKKILDEVFVTKKYKDSNK